ncbi:MAG: polyphosphate kinase 1 [Pseudomonadales bacterium]
MPNNPASDAEQRYYPHQLSWLAFNERVLQEAADEDNPIVERVRFLGIYSSNMDEFYRVRFADVKRQFLIYKEQGDEVAAEETRQLMEQIQTKVLTMTEKFDRLYSEVFKGLARYNIHIIHSTQLSEHQRNWLEHYFMDQILCHIAPIMLHKGVDLAKRLNDSSTYLMVAINRQDKKTRYAVVEAPTERISRFVFLPPERSRKKKHFILLEDIILTFLEKIFRGFVKFDSLEGYSFKVTRDAEYSINDEIEESYVDKMSESMKQRLSAEPVRMIHDSDMPPAMLERLLGRLKIGNLDSVIAGGPYRNFKDFIGFPNVGRKYLENPPLPPLSCSDFTRHDTVFDAIEAGDILLHYPYHTFLHFTEFVRQAAFDPNVRHIRINLYRVANKSRIVSSLIDAVDNGKTVTAVVELRARFDEEANIEWSKLMRDSGIRVVFGVPALKIHSKLCVVSREVKGQLMTYSHFGTGNFNENTAKIYTDFSLFTFNQELGDEGLRIFELIQNPFSHAAFNHLQISPINARQKILTLIKDEIEFAERGKKAAITLKINNLVDSELIDALYAASDAGVTIRLLVRGMCSLMPGIKGLSDNITIISIVDRFLEHPRVMLFEHGGEKIMYITSADWMTRNMDNRIEVGCPVYDEKLKKTIMDILEIQFNDTLKARVIDSKQQNRYVKRGNRKKLRSQTEIYNYFKQREKQAER